jgi:hypothetical protein
MFNDPHKHRVFPVVVFINVKVIATAGWWEKNGNEVLWGRVSEVCVGEEKNDEESGAKFLLISPLIHPWDQYD